MKVFLLLLIIFIAYLIQSVTGYGGALLSMPIAIILIGLNDARVVINMMSCVGGIIIACRYRRYIVKNKLIGILTVMLVGVIVSFGINDRVDNQILVLIYGLIAIANAFWGFVKKETAKAEIKKSISYLILFLAGIMQGLFSSGGAFLIIYALYAFETKEEFRATSCAVWGFINALLFLWQFKAGAVNPITIKLILLGLPVIALSIVVAELLYKRIEQKIFSIIVNIVLFISGVTLIVGNLG